MVPEGLLREAPLEARASLHCVVGSWKGPGAHRVLLGPEKGGAVCQRVCALEVGVHHVTTTGIGNGYPEEGQGSSERGAERGCAHHSSYFKQQPDGPTVATCARMLQLSTATGLHLVGGSLLRPPHLF